MLPSIVAAARTNRPEENPHDRRRRRMSRVDTAWLRMDNDVNLMMIVGVWLLTPGHLDALRERIADKLLKYDRFRQKVVADAMGASGSRTNTSTSTRHVVPNAAAPNRGEPSARPCSALRRTGHPPLDPRHPLWQFHLVEDYEGGSASSPHPPLHRRRHRADLGDAVDHRRRQ
jgi:diacylglycerol O-acyltransferase